MRGQDIDTPGPLSRVNNTIFDVNRAEIVINDGTRYVSPNYYYYYNFVQ